MLELTGKEIMNKGIEFFEAHTFTSRVGNILISIWAQNSRVYGQLENTKTNINITRRHFTFETIN